LREPTAGLARAALAVITRADQVTPEELERIRSRIKATAAECAVAEVAFPFTQFINADGNVTPLDELRGRPIAAFCGIGNPEAFRVSLERSGFSVCAFRSFPDHHAYTRADINELEEWAAGLDACAIVVTQKDLVKIGLRAIGGRPLLAVQIGTQVLRGAMELDQQFEKLLAMVDQP
jgi:tetraacyldisaccharide 4'-kinase